MPYWWALRRAKQLSTAATLLCWSSISVVLMTCRVKCFYVVRSALVYFFGADQVWFTRSYVHVQHFRLRSCTDIVLPLYTLDYPCIPLNTAVYPWIPFYTLEYPCVPLYNLEYPCVPLTTPVYPCIPLNTLVYPCIPLITPEYHRILLTTPVYLCIPLNTLVYLEYPYLLFNCIQ